MTQVKSDNLQDYIDRCGAEAEVEIEETADKLDDKILGYVFAGEYGLKPFRSWNSVSTTAYFKQLVRKYTVDVLFLMISCAAFVAATIFENDASVRYTAQAFFALMAILFATVITLEFRLQLNFFKEHGYPLKENWTIRDNAVRMIGVGEKFVYSASTRQNRRRIFPPELVVAYDSYADISRVDLIELPNRTALSIVGTKLGLDIVQDPDFANFEDAISEMRDRIKNQGANDAFEKTMS